MSLKIVFVGGVAIELLERCLFILFSPGHKIASQDKKVDCHENHENNGDKRSQECGIGVLTFVIDADWMAKHVTTFHVCKVF